MSATLDGAGGAILEASSVLLTGLASRTIDRVARGLDRRTASERVARSRANRRIALLGHALVWGLVVLLLAVVASLFSALVVALAWGILLASHAFFFVLAPELRERWVRAEVGPRVQEAVTEERRNEAGRHGRSLVETTAQLAHEIRNPITAARSLVQQIAEDPSSSDVREYARVAVEELDRVERSIAHLLRFAKEEAVELVPTRLEESVEAALQTLRERSVQGGVVIENDLAKEGRMLGDPEKLRRIVVNLVGNALDALRDARTVHPRVWISTGSSLTSPQLWLRVRDNGPGIEPERLSQIFTPFHTTKRDGTGLGLAITKKLVEAHGGSIEARRAPGAGAEFLVSFPQLSEESEKLT